MRLSSFLAPALASVATAAAADQLPTEAYILRSKLPSARSPASIPHELVQAILLQRLSTPDQSYPLGHLPDSISQDDAISLISRLGNPPLPLFQQPSRDQPRQLVIQVSGVTADNYVQIKKAISPVPLAFTSDHALSLPISENSNKCAFESLIDSNNADCWEGNAQYLRYDAATDADIIKKLASNLATLKSAAQNARMESVILLVSPEATHARRRVEKPMNPSADSYTFDPSNPDTTDTAIFDHDDSAHVVEKPPVSFARPTGIIPSCFTSEEACMKATNNCTGHGECVHKYSATDGPACFHCKCMHTREKNSQGQESIYRWGGNTCQKIDISQPFWMFAGVGLALAITIGFCITLLYNVGEEKLPGVIGAGVSRGSSK